MNNKYLDKIALYFKDPEARVKHERAKFQVSANNHVLKHSKKIRAQLKEENKVKKLSKTEMKNRYTEHMASNGKFKKDFRNSHKEHTTKLRQIEDKYGMKPSDFMDPETMTNIILGNKKKLK